jgi:hypothetical protein
LSLRSPGWLATGRRTAHAAGPLAHAARVDIIASALGAGHVQVLRAPGRAPLRGLSCARSLAGIPSEGCFSWRLYNIRLHLSAPRELSWCSPWRTGVGFCRSPTLSSPRMLVRSRCRSPRAERTRGAAGEPEPLGGFGDGTESGAGTRMCSRRRRLALSSVLPVSRTTLEMRNRDDDDLAGANSVHELVRKPGYQEATGVLVGRHGIPGLGTLGQLVNRLCDFVQQFGSETGALRLVPTDRLGQFDGRVGVDPDWWRHRPRTSRSMRRLTSSQGSRVAVPASMDATRFSISAAHWLAASASAGPSRLASSSAASSARAWSSRRRASTKTAATAWVTVGSFYASTDRPTSGCTRRSGESWPAAGEPQRYAGDS